MARINTVKSARKPQGNCRTCGKAINKGDPYKWAKPRYSGKIVVCATCQIKASMLTTSDKLSDLYAAQEDIGEASNLEDLVSALEDAISTAEDVSERYTESADNQEEYFPGSYQIDEIREKAEACDSWKDELETAKDEVETAQGEVEELQNEVDQLGAEEAELDGKDELTKEEQERLDEIGQRLDEIASEIQDKESEAFESASTASLGLSM